MPQYAVEPGFEAQLAEGLRRFQHGDHNAAIAAYTNALDQLAPNDPARAEVYGRRGHARFIRRDLQGALDDYGLALTLDPRLADVYAHRGLVYYQMGRAMAALADYDAAIALFQLASQPTSQQRHALAEALFNRGNTQYQRRDYTAAISDYSAALALEPTQLDALIYRGVAHFQLGEDAAAEHDYLAAADHATCSPVQRAAIFYNHGLLLRQRGNLAGALAAYTAALELQPNDADCLMNRGNAHAEGGDLPAAIADFSAALRLNPWLDDGFNICGMARLQAGDLEAAIADFSRAIQHNPQAASVHFNRGCARLQAGDYAGAINDLTTELGLHAPGLKGRVETRERRAEIYNNRGLAHHYLGAFDAAIADYERAIANLRLAGSPAETAERLASSLLNRGVAYCDRAATADAATPVADRRSAAADFAQALELAPTAELAAELRHYLNAVA